MWSQIMINPSSFILDSYLLLSCTTNMTNNSDKSNMAI